MGLIIPFTNLKINLEGEESMQLRMDPSLFWEDEELPDFCLEDKFNAEFSNSFVWLTSKGLRTSLHSDEDDGLLLHLNGRKRAKDSQTYASQHGK